MSDMDRKEWDEPRPPRQDPRRAEIERLQAECARLNELFALQWDATQSAETEAMKAEVERLRGENSHLQVVLQNLVTRPNDPVCQRQARAALEEKQ